MYTWRAISGFPTCPRCRRRICCFVGKQYSRQVNIASGHSIQVKELIDKIANKVGKPELVKLGAIPFSKQEPLFIGANTKLLREEVKWSPKFDLDTGIDQTISWWEKNRV